MRNTVCRLSSYKISFLLGNADVPWRFRDLTGLETRSFLVPTLGASASCFSLSGLFFFHTDCITVITLRIYVMLLLILMISCLLLMLLSMLSALGRV